MSRNKRWLEYQNKESTDLDDYESLRDCFGFVNRIANLTMSASSEQNSRSNILVLYQKMTVEEKFGTPPPVISCTTVAVCQLVISIIILYVIKPPFIILHERVSLSIVLMISIGITATSAFAYKANASSSDICRGLFEIVRVCGYS